MGNTSQLLQSGMPARLYSVPIRKTLHADMVLTIGLPAFNVVRLHSRAPQRLAAAAAAGSESKAKAVQPCTDVKDAMPKSVCLPGL